MLLPQGIGISIISLAEIYTGIYRLQNPEKKLEDLKEFLFFVPVVFIDEETAKIFGKENSRLRQAGEGIDGFDLLIASTCLRFNLILLTQNRRHFDRVKGLQIHSV
jgi:predicted nucleic acid-binding protein